ncbi:MAG: O-methyltransferase, partial [Campylobacterota bacterium]|nr:O-methyltransferase [Campylobacterota bacterium]
SVLSCDFDNIDFIRKGNEALEINVPNLTFREIKYLNKYISLNDITKFPKDVSGKRIDTIVPAKEIKMYHEIYRYFPTFSEASL